VTAGGDLVGFRHRQEEYLDQNFFIARCSGAHASACVSQAQAWKRTEEIKSGDTIALVSQATGKTFSCSVLGCGEDIFPPNSLSPLLTIAKIVNNASAAPGSAINFDDEISFRSLQYHADLMCNETNCMISLPPNDSTVGGKFRLVKSQADNIVSPNALIKLMQPAGMAAALNGMRRSSADTTSNWFLTKCVGMAGLNMCDTTHEAMNLGDYNTPYNTWARQDHIKSGDLGD
jgi:hypothetical protein